MAVPREKFCLFCHQLLWVKCYLTNFHPELKTLSHTISANYTYIHVLIEATRTHVRGISTKYTKHSVA